MAEGRLLLLAAILLYFFALNWVWILLAHPLGRLHDLPIVIINVVASGGLLLMLRWGFTPTVILTLWTAFVFTTAWWACVCRPMLGLDKWLLIIPMQVFFVLGSRAGSFALSVSIVLHVGLHSNLQSMMELMSCEPFTHDLFYEAKGRLWANLCFATYVGLCCVGYEFARTHAEDALLQALHEKDCINARLREADKAKERFLANTSHGEHLPPSLRKGPSHSFLTSRVELRTPLHGILAMVHELSEDAQVRGNTKLRETIGIVSDCADHLYSLITDILDFEMLMRDQPVINLSTLSLTDEVLQVCNVLAPQAKEKKLIFEKDIKVAHNERIGDARRLRQVLYNLTANAVKFTPEGGTVRVSVRDGASDELCKSDKSTTTQSDDDGDDMVVMQVSDTGIGIAESMMPSLFTGFSQGDASLRRKYGGNGLGLAISRRLALAMHGDIECSSRLGHGSTFTASVRLPRAPLSGGGDDDARRAPLVEWPLEGSAALASPRSARLAATGEVAEVKDPSNNIAAKNGEQRRMLEGEAMSEDSLGGMRVLLAEDNVVNQKVGVRMLRALGCQPMLAVNGSEALAAIKRHYDSQAPGDHVDIVLMDCQMPIMDGFTATEEIRKLEADLRTAAGTEVGAGLGGQARDLGGPPHVPIVALTASATPDYQQKCFAHGMDGFLSKPLRKDTLADTLRKWLASARRENVT